MAPRFFVNDPDLAKARRDPLTAPVVAGKPKRPAKEYADQGTVGPADYADPQNFKYPLHKPANVKAAIQHFSNAKNAGKYPADEQAAIWGRIKAAAGKFRIAIQERKIPMSKSMSGLERINQYLELSKAGGPYIGPHGGKWADPQHKVSWKELGKTSSGKPVHEATHEKYNTRGKVKGEPRHGNALYEPKLMREQFPQHTKQDHADAAKIHQEHAEKTAAEHTKLVHRADTVHGVTLNSRDDFNLLPKGMGEEIDALKEQSTKSSMAAKSHEAAGKAMKRNPRQAEPQPEEPKAEAKPTASGEPTDREKFDRDRPDVKAAEMSHAAKQASEKIKGMRPGDPGFQEAHTAAAEGHRKAREALNSARDEQQKATGFSRGSQGTDHTEGIAYHEHQAKKTGKAPEKKTPALDAMREKIAAGMAKFGKPAYKPDLTEVHRLRDEAHTASDKTKGMKRTDPGFHEAHKTAEKAHHKARIAFTRAADKEGKATGTHPGYSLEALRHDKFENHHRIATSNESGGYQVKQEKPKALQAKLSKDNSQYISSKANEASKDAAVQSKAFPSQHTAIHERAASFHRLAAKDQEKAGFQEAADNHRAVAKHHDEWAANKPGPAPAPEKKPESGPTKKDQLDLFGGSKVKKSFGGIEGMLDYLRKSEPQALPTGEPSMGGSGAEQGGDVAGKGKVGGSPDSAPSKGFDKDGKAQGVSPGKTEKLSEDDEDVEAQLKNKAPKTLGKSMAMPAHQREMVAREHALAVSRLVRGQRDIVVGCGPGAPPAAPEPLRKAHSWAQGRDSRVVYSDASDQAVEQLLKGDSFYTYQAPTTKRDSILIHQVRECAACQGTFTKSLASCPHCGVGSLNPLVAIHGHEPVEELQKSRAPLLRPRVERDLYFGKK